MLLDIVDLKPFFTIKLGERSDTCLRVFEIGDHLVFLKKHFIS